MIKSSFNKIVLFFFTLLVFVNCEASAVSKDKMIVFVYNPIEDNINRSYEISFYDDGLVKKIKKYSIDRNLDDLASWDPLKSGDTLEGEFIVKREGSLITQFELSKSGEEIFLDSYDISDPNLIINVSSFSPGVENRIVIKDHIASYFYKNRMTFEYEISDNEINMRTSKGISRIYEYSNDRLSKYAFNGSSSSWSAEIEYDGENLYSLIEPNHGDSIPFTRKFSIIVPFIDFSNISKILNSFLLFPLDRDDGNYVNPFVMHKTITEMK